MKKINIVLAAILVFVSVASAVQKIEHTFSRSASPQAGQVIMTGVDFTTTQTVDVNLPDNLRYVLTDGFVVTTGVDTLSAGAAITLTEVTAGNAATNTLVSAATLSTNSVAYSVEAVTNAQTVAVQGTSTLRLSITGGTATNDVKDVVLNLLAL